MYRSFSKNNKMWKNKPKKWKKNQKIKRKYIKFYIFIENLHREDVRHKKKIQRWMTTLIEEPWQRINKLLHISSPCKMLYRYTQILKCANFVCVSLLKKKSNLKNIH